MSGISRSLGKNIFPCFQAERSPHGNSLDLWAGVPSLPRYEAALQLPEVSADRHARRGGGAGAGVKDDRTDFAISKTLEL